MLPEDPYDDEAPEPPEGWEVCPDCGSADGVCFDGAPCFRCDDDDELGEAGA